MSKLYKSPKPTIINHIWNEENDRWMYLEYRNDKLIGMNFMQGDYYEVFKQDWCNSDKGLMDYYNSMVKTFPIEKESVTTLCFINKCMWAYHTAISLSQENPYFFNN